jgi:hypothetical protein
MTHVTSFKVLKLHLNLSNVEIQISSFQIMEQQKSKGANLRLPVPWGGEYDGFTCRQRHALTTDQNLLDLHLSHRQHCLRPH